MNDSSRENSIKHGKLLASPLPGEEIAISGISGVFPKSNNVEEFKDNLYNQVDMITYSKESLYPEFPFGLGKFKDKPLTKFDMGFFGICKRQAKTMNEMGRVLLEKCVECIFDAGLHPSDLEGTRTGVFLAISFNETEWEWYFRHQVEQGQAILGNTKSAIANRISYFLKLTGPSFNNDTACSSGMFAVDRAYRAIRMGEVDQALVCGASVLLSPLVTLQFARIGALSKEGVLRAFDENGTGYVRAETISAMLIQKTKDCKRIYAKILHTKTNCDGYCPNGITYPDKESQGNLLREVYEESGVNPLDISYIEAHATGTPVGDAVEGNNIDEFFTRGRRMPLLVGAVKSNMGHPEPASTFCSIIKSILVFESNLIPPNLNFKTPRQSIPGLLEGRLKVVVEKTKLKDDNGLIACNSFGFGGSSAHAILKWNTKKKINNGTPEDSLPRIVCVSGRTEEAVISLLDDIAEKFDVEYIALIHNSFRKPVQNHLYRGYIIVSKMGVSKRSVSLFNPNKSYFHVHFGGFPKNSGALVKQLLQLSLLCDFKTRIEQFLIKKQLILNGLLSHPTASHLNYILVGNITQLCIVELFRELEIEIKESSGQSFGALTCAYFKNAMCLEEVLDCAYVVGKVAGQIEQTENGNSLSVERFIKYRDQITKGFQEILRCPKQRNTGEEATVVSAEYLVDFIFTTVEDKIPRKSIILEMGQGLNLPKQTVLNLDVNGGIQSVLELLGSLYEYGLQPQVQKLYPKLEFPVSRGTPMISSKIQWKHDYKFMLVQSYVPKHTGSKLFKINIGEDTWAYLDGHIIDGRNLFPATGYLYLVWKVISDFYNIDLNYTKIVFENCKFKRACTLPKVSTRSDLELLVMVQEASGKFEISESNIPVVTGKVKLVQKILGAEFENVDLGTKNDLSKRDIYKELRLRGYHYKGLFKGLMECNTQGTKGKIQWADNWIAFMDNMLQIKILSSDTRLLYVPIKIAKLTIDPAAHLKALENWNSGEAIVNIPLQYNSSQGIIKSGGIEIHGLLVSSIPRKKYTGIPVLEKYQFVPNEARLTLAESVRLFLQVALENDCGLKVKVAELIDDASKDDMKLLAPIIQEVLEDQPLVQCEVTIHTGKNLMVDMPIQSEKLKSGSDYTVIVCNEIFSRKETFDDVINAMSETGFILTRELPTINLSSINLSNLVILNVSETEQEKFIFLKKKSNNSLKPKVYVNINTKNKSFDWLDALKDAVNKNCDVVAWTQNDPINGIMGLVNCIRREPGCSNVKCFFIFDQAPDFNASHPFYQNQIDKNMAINVYANGQWGTYRHLLLEDMEEAKNEHCYVNTTIRGDLSSLKWIEGPLSQNTELNQDESLVDVYYSSLNFKDVMIASGRINVAVGTDNECNIGFEFSGKTKSGKSVMGISTQGALATMVKADNNLLWDVPKNWSLKDAATVPVVYGTCLYALVVIGRIKKTDSVLIHSGTGGIGQAAINLCLEMGCTVFTTVGTKEKRTFIKKHFPEINERHIGNSRDMGFEKMIMRETDGKGVDIVLNSLAEEKLFASTRCLAVNGRFLEIGKYDLENDNQLSLECFKKGASYHGVMLDILFASSAEVKQDLKLLVQKYIDSGAVRPLEATVFGKGEIEQAFRYMASGKHMGKVVAEIRKEDEIRINPSIKSKGLSRYYCNPKKSYIICGGLGGFGLELADWLIFRGARNVILTSRKGVTTGYQKYKIYTWKRCGCIIHISTQDITSKPGCVKLINEANSVAPVDAIFNLAVVLQDAILDNQTKKSFLTSFAPKSYATEYLDDVSRELCPDLRDFVVFSSVSCGRGNAGQANYGMSNSVMERICEKRRREGYPALAIQWGAVGDVGLVAELQEDHIELQIGGTLQQSVTNCLQVMDVLLRQREASVVSSMVVAEKKTDSLSGKIEDIAAAILGIKDIKTVNANATLAELGMDSIMSVEIKQILEREYNIFLSPSEMKNITLARIQELQDKSFGPDLSTDKDSEDLINLFKIVNSINVEKAKSFVVKLRTRISVKQLPKVIFLPGIEGYCDMLENLTQNMEVEAYGLNYPIYKYSESIIEMADTLLPHLEDLLRPEKSFNLVAHSVGSLVALELVYRLEKLGYRGNLTLLDGSPSAIKNILNSLITNGDSSDAALENFIISAALKYKLKAVELENTMKTICKCSTLQEKVQLWATAQNLDQSVSEETALNTASAVVKRTKACLQYTPSFEKLKSQVSLFKPTVVIVTMDSEDLGLSQYCERPVAVKVFKGNHNSFLAEEDMAKAIMDNLLVMNGATEH